MKKSILITLLLAAPLHARLAQQHFSFMVTGSLGLVGEYAKKDSPPQRNRWDKEVEGKGGELPVPQSMAASFALGFEFAYTWIWENEVLCGFDIHAGMRLTDVPYFWRGGSYLIQPYGGATAVFASDFSKGSLLLDLVGFSAGGFLYGGATPPISIAVVLPLGVQVLWGNLRISLRHELEFIMGYNKLEKGQPAAYRQSDACKYNLIFGIGWGFNLFESAQKRKTR